MQDAVCARSQQSISRDLTCCSSLMIYNDRCNTAVAQQFKAQKGRSRGDLPAITRALGLDPQVVLNQPWTELSVRSVPPAA